MFVAPRMGLGISTIGLAAALIAALQPAQPAHAGVVAKWADAKTYTYKFTHVPDFDQCRIGLPGEGGAYCVPTSAINWMAYFANHGAPYIAPGPGWWQTQEIYDDATSAIALMGAFMLTHPDDGTVHSWGQAGVRMWLALHEAPCIAILNTSDKFTSPTFQDASESVFAGGYVMLGMGWYQDDGTGYLERNGGHKVSLTYGARANDSKLVGWRDPRSDEGDLFMQSPFSTEKFPIVDEIALPKIGVPLPRFMSRPVGYGTGLIDNYVAIFPRFALSSTPAGLGLLVHHYELFWDPWPPIYSEFQTPEDTVIKAAHLHPDGLHFLFLAEAEDPELAPRLWRTNRVTNKTEEIILAADDPRDIIIGRLRGLYLLDGDDLVLVAIDPPEPTEEARIIPPAPCAALAYDGDSDKVLLLSMQTHSLIRYPHWLVDCEPEILLLPAELPLQGRTRLKWDPSRQGMWLLSEASDSVYRLWQDDLTGDLLAAEYTHELLTDPVDLDVDDAGRLYVSNDGSILEFDIFNTTLTPAEDPCFAGAEAGDFLCVAKSSSNHDPAIHTFPEWRDEPPAQQFGDPIYDCPPDLDDNRIVDVLDLLALLAAWGDCPPDHFCHADFDYTGVVDVLDLLTLLGAWGPCP